MAERNDIFPPNSERMSRERSTVSAEDKPPERKHLQPIAKRVGPKKETAFQKFKNVFLADDVNEIGEYAIRDLIIPTIKDVFMNFMYAALWGNKQTGSGYREIGRQRTNYNKISSLTRVGSGIKREKEREDYSEERQRFDVSDLVFSTRGQAEEILNALEDYIDDYGQVTVGCLYELVEETAPFTAEYYGWRTLRSARIIRVSNGYSLELPKPVRL